MWTPGKQKARKMPFQVIHLKKKKGKKKEKKNDQLLQIYVKI